MKSMMDPDMFYNEYVSDGYLNVTYSISETRDLLKENYIRLEPEFPNNITITLDSAAAETVQTIKFIGINWITQLNESKEKDKNLDLIIKGFIKEHLKFNKNSIIDMPTYYSYQECYKKIEDSLDDYEKFVAALIEFKFPKNEVNLVEPKNMT